MKFISELYNQYPGSDIYVVGTGTSMRVFPSSFFEDKLVIGLNMAWKLLPVQYCVTIHPDLNIPEFIQGEKAHPEINWIIKHQKARKLLTAVQLEYAEKHFYFFEADGKDNTQPADQPSDAGRMIEWVKTPVQDKLYQWSSISQTGVNLAANMGAKNIILVGCDNCSLVRNHHAHQQHTRWKGVEPQVRYWQYYEGLAELRATLRERGVNLMSLTPFLGLDSPEGDFQRLCKEIDAPLLIQNTDISDEKSRPRQQPTSWKHKIKKGVQRLATALTLS